MPVDAAAAWAGLQVGELPPATEVLTIPRRLERHHLLDQPIHLRALLWLPLLRPPTLDQGKQSLHRLGLLDCERGQRPARQTQRRDRAADDGAAAHSEAAAGVDDEREQHSV